MFWVEEGRGNATRQRAANAGLTGQTTLAAALSASEFVLSVVPPHAAVSSAATVAEHHFQGVYVDCNAVSPATGAKVGSIVG